MIIHLLEKLQFLSGNIRIKDGNDEVVINRADILKLYGSNANNISSGKVLLYNANGSLYCHCLKFRYATRSLEFQPRSQNGNI